MYKHDLVYLTEDASHDAAIELINEEAFGPVQPLLLRVVRAGDHRSGVYGRDPSRWPDFGRQGAECRD